MLLIIFNKVPKNKHNFKIKIDPKMCTFKEVEEIWKTWKKIVATLFIYTGFLTNQN